MNKSVIGFIRHPFHTIHIDIKRDKLDIITSFDKNTQYEVRRAAREGVEFRLNSDLVGFVGFYNEFAASKSKESIAVSDLECYMHDIVVTMASYQNNIVVMHSYLVDNQGKARVRLLHSASHFRSLSSSQERALVGRANRFLHFEDMLYFKNMGFSVYDFGGISIDNNDEEQRKIGLFKRGFGGLIVEESNFMSLGLSLLLGIRSQLSKLLMR